MDSMNLFLKIFVEMSKIKIFSLREVERDLMRNESYFVCAANWIVNSSECKGEKPKSNICDGGCI